MSVYPRRAPSIRTFVAYHATREPDAVRAAGVVRPSRLPDVYAFTDRGAAETYAQEFGYADVVAIEVKRGFVVTRWAPSYCTAGKVLRIGAECRVVA